MEMDIDRPENIICDGARVIFQRKDWSKEATVGIGKWVYFPRYRVGSCCLGLFVRQIDWLACYLIAFWFVVDWLIDWLIDFCRCDLMSLVRRSLVISKLKTKTDQVVGLPYGTLVEWNKQTGRFDRVSETADDDYVAGEFLVVLRLISCWI